MIENHDNGCSELLRNIFPQTGNAYVIGVTGPPGSGKSSLVDRLIQSFRARQEKVAVLAVDPTSPISGGAILGDRVRMIDHSLDSSVYIRSMASRGDEGGLSKAAKNATRILDAAGNEIVIVETVGIGQAEFEIVGVADVVIVVLMPETGDEIQANKAGILEIGDIFAVNKSDLPGADKVIYNLDTVLTTKSGWRQTALKVSAKTGEGINELVTELDKFHEHLRNSEIAIARKEKIVAKEILQDVTDAYVENLRNRITSDPSFQKLVKQVSDRKLDPDSAARQLAQKHSTTK